MPFLEDGTQVEMIVDILGVGNRLNGKQLGEIELNSYKETVRSQIIDMDNLDDKVNHLFKFAHMVNESYGNDLERFYNRLSDNEKIEFIEDIEENSFSVKQPPMYGNLDLDGYDRIATEFNIKPVNAYIYKFGRKIKLMNKVIVGDKYIYKLKHHPKGKFSSRSTSFVNSKDQPAKSSSTKQNKSIYPTTPLREGNMELTNLLINNNPMALTKMNMQYSSSIKARRHLDQLYEGPLNIEELEMPDDATNRNAEINNILFKALGIKLDLGEK